MRFLITNDDGILAHGIECLAEAAEPLGDVYVVAPDREQSATSHSLTLHHPLRPVQRADRVDHFAEQRQGQRKHHCHGQRQR